MPRAPQERSSIEGEYAIDQFILILSPDHPIIDSTTFALRALSDATLSVLFHEYVHYLQNITTLAGYHSFFRTLALWRLFTETVRPDGTSKGSDALADERAGWVAQYLAIAERFDGDVEAHLPEDFVVDSFQITACKPKPFYLPLGEETARVTEVTLSGEAFDPASIRMPFKYRLGVMAIMEGVAHGLDRCVALGLPGTRAEPNSAPPFPYHVLRESVGYLVPTADPLSVIRLGCLALMSNDPAGSLIDLCQLASERMTRGVPLPAALDDIAQTCSVGIHAFTDEIVSKDIPQQEADFGSAGTLNKAVVHIYSLFKKNLLARKLDPTLELTAFTAEGRVDFARLRALLERYPPCTILQKNTGSENTMQRDILAGADTFADTLRDEMAVLQCALHFMSAHLNRLAQNFTETRFLGPSACPFYTVCDLPLRREAPGICKSKPWKALRWKGWKSQKRCWYGAAVDSSIRRASGPLVNS